MPKKPSEPENANYWEMLMRGTTERDKQTGSWTTLPAKVWDLVPRGFLSPLKTSKLCKRKLKSEILTLFRHWLLWQLISVWINCHCQTSEQTLKTVRTLSPGIYKTWWLHPSFHLTKTEFCNYSLKVQAIWASQTVPSQRKARTWVTEPTKAIWFDFCLLLYVYAVSKSSCQEIR